MDSPETPLKALHNQFCRLTGRNLNYTFYIREWRDFSQHFTEQDLNAVLAWVARENAKREQRYRIRTELLRIIGDLQLFEQLRAEAELESKRLAAKRRQVLPSTGSVELAAMRHEPAPVTPEQPVKRVSLEFISETIKRANQ